MSKVVRVVVAALVGVALFIQTSAEAASPASGTITRSKRSVKWSGGPYQHFGWSDYTGLTTCEPPADFMCDHFQLKVNLGEGANVEVRVTTANPNPSGGIQPVDGDDYDVYIYAPDGTLVGEGATEKGNERAVFRHRARFRGKAYDVAVKPWSVTPGSSYKGSAKAVTLGRR